MTIVHDWKGDTLYELFEGPLPSGESWSPIWRKDGDVYRCSGLVTNHAETVFYADLPYDDDSEGLW